MTSTGCGILSALTELAGGLLLAAGAATPLVASPLVTPAIVIVVRARWSGGGAVARQGEGAAHAP